MNLYNVYDHKRDGKLILDHVRCKAVIQTLGIAKSHMYFVIDQGSLYKNRYEIVQVDNLPEKLKEEWDKCCFNLRSHVSPEILRKITFYGVNHRGEVIR